MAADHANHAVSTRALLNHSDIINCVSAKRRWRTACASSTPQLGDPRISSTVSLILVSATSGPPAPRRGSPPSTSPQRSGGPGRPSPATAAMTRTPSDGPTAGGAATVGRKSLSR